MSKKIGEARELGDLKENAEYHAAREEQYITEARIGELEGKLGSAQIIDDAEIFPDAIYVGATVTLLDLDYDDEIITHWFLKMKPIWLWVKYHWYLLFAKLAWPSAVGDEVEIEVPAENN